MDLRCGDRKIVKSRKGDNLVWFSKGIDWKSTTDPEAQELLRMIQRASGNTMIDDNSFLNIYIANFDKLFNNKFNDGSPITDAINSLKVFEDDLAVKVQNDENLQKQIKMKDIKGLAKDVIGRLMDFFIEFKFEPNFRFVNTLFLQGGSEAKKSYIMNYFSLSDSPYKSMIYEKMKSDEFSKILEDAEMIHPSSVINSRFKVYYGSQGTGKTTKAMIETDGRCMVCHSAMLPSDLMEDFGFNDGKAEFTPSILYHAMENGEKITLDELNLLPFESLRFLQSILDGKKEFTYKGRKVEIADGFMVIGTMNLTVNGCVYNLPEPLVDRACELSEFKLTAKDLVSAVL